MPAASVQIPHLTAALGPEAARASSVERLPSLQHASSPRGPVIPGTELGLESLFQKALKNMCSGSPKGIRSFCSPPMWTPGTTVPAGVRRQSPRPAPCDADAPSGSSVLSGASRCPLLRTFSPLTGDGFPRCLPASRASREAVLGSVCPAADLPVPASPRHARGCVRRGSGVREHEGPGRAREGVGSGSVSCTLRA